MRLWLARSLVGLVLFINVECAVLFLWKPEAYAPSFDLAGPAGMAWIRGLGLLFLMWNVPYLAAMLDPRKHRTSLYEAIAMQTIGVAGETYILTTLPTTQSMAHAAIERFIAFDSAGLLALMLAAWITRKLITNPSPGAT